MKPFIQKSITSLIVFVATIWVVQAQEVSKTFAGIKKINLTTSSGDVVVAKGSSNEVRVKVTFTYSTSEYQPLLEQYGSTLTLKEDFNRRSVSGKSTWVLTIPDGLELHSSSGSGDFEASDVKVKISANTGSGDYTWRNVSGDSKINTGSGDIKVDAYQGDININTGSGDITIAKTNGDVRANAGSGNISLVVIKGGIFANSGSGNIKAQELTLMDKGSFNSGSGDVLLVLSAPIAYALSVNSGSGDAVVDCKGTKLEGKLIMTASKKHGEIKAPFTFDKTEELDEDGYDNVRIRKTVQLGSSDVEIKISTGSGTAEVKK
jgi:DUF4097 and DUF4098 domain-containing protein YvlB